jgi:hypothetical protein
MEERYTRQDVVKERFEATKQRGKYLAYIVRELDAAGFKDFDDALKKAIFKFGKEKSQSWGDIGARDFMKKMISDEVAVETMKCQEVGESTDDRAEFTFGRCPLEEGWREMKLSDEERDRLCGLALEHDFGIVDNDAILKLDMPEAIGKGDPVCRLIFTRMASTRK